MTQLRYLLTKKFIAAFSFSLVLVLLLISTQLLTQPQTALAYPGEEFSLNDEESTSIPGDEYNLSNGGDDETSTSISGDEYDLSTPTPTCSETVRQYPQCGGTFGLEDKDPTHTFLVTEFTNTCTRVKRWTSNPEDLGNRGQCGVAQPTPIPVQACEPEFRYPECDATGPGWVHEAWQDCHGNFSFRNIHFQGGVCGHTFAPTPTPAPAQVVVVVPTPTPLPVVFITPTPVLVIVVTPTPTPTPVPAGAPAPAVVARVSCPDGFVQTISGSNILCMQQIQNQQQSTSSLATASTGPINVSVVGFDPPTDILPKTGLPVFAWAFTGFAPLGFGLTRFRNSAKVSSNIAHFLWQKREFKRE